MSGLEAAGLVLGAWPLVVNLLTLYHSGRNGYEWELLLHEFQTEEVIYIDCIRSLLQANVSESMLLKLSDRRNPDQQLWKTPELRKSLEDRLGPKHFPIILKTLESMEGLLKTLHEKLQALELSHDASFPRVRSGLRHIRVNLPNASIRDSMQKLFKFNAQLQRIITSHGSIDSNLLTQWQQTKSTTKLPPETLKRITAQANALHDAMVEGYKCDCDHPHQANLRTHSPDDLDLVQPFELLFPVDEETAKQIMQEDVVTSPMSTIRGSSDNFDIDGSSVFTSRRWSHRGSVDPIPSPLSSPSTTPPAFRHRSISFSQAKGPEDGGLIEDLCQFIRGLGHEPSTTIPATCLGVLGVEKQRYTVKVTSLDESSAQASTFVCLDDYLPKEKVWEANRKGKMDLALNLSLAILQYYSTPWINMWWTWKDFCMLRGDKSQIFVTKRFYSVHSSLNNKFQDTHSASSSAFWDIMGEPVLTRLGFALVELALGKRLCELREPDSAICGDDDMLDMHTALSLVEEGMVEGETSTAFSAAVLACLKHQFLSEKGRVMALDSKHADFKHEMGQFVVAPIMGAYDSSWGQVSAC